MMVLWEHGSITVKDAGQLLYLDSGTLTPLFKKLEEKGLVVRARSKTDERNLIVSLTEKGEAMKDQALDIPGQLSACLCLKDGEADELYRLLHKILGADA